MKAQGLPALRQELDLLPGPRLTDGQPSWTLHDPVRNQFFRIDWPTLEMLERWDLHDPQKIVDDIRRQTTLDLGPEDVAQLADFLIQNQLVQVPGAQTSQRMAMQWHRQNGSWWQWLLHHYLFFRIPLWRPDAWLARNLPTVRRVVGPGFWVLSAIVLVFGLSQVLRRWDEFVASLVDTFNWQGLLAYGLALVVVKFLHELGHAFTAKHHGCRVPAMGLAFLVMWPVAYTDTNETWRLTDRLKRLQVASAGIATELVLAVWATAAWALLPPGHLQSVAFVLATTSWVATLAINASPFMRFDGYFILMDALDMPNLHARSFALARWRLREWLFDLGEPPPEYFAQHVQRGLVAFAWATWLYRLVLFLGIALLVYHFFFKLLGVFLFAVELLWFVFKPVASEVQAWRALWPRIRQRARSRYWVWAALGLVLVLLAPWPGRISGSAVLKPQQSWPLFAPAGARVEAMLVQHRQEVQAGQALMRLHVPDLEGRALILQSRLQQQRMQASSSAFDEDMRKRWMVHEQSAALTQAELDGLVAERQPFEPAAPFDGQFFQHDPDLAVGQWVGKKEPLGVVVQAAAGWRVESWLDEDDVARVRVGQSAMFYADAVHGGLVRMTVVGVDRDAARVLNRPELASAHGGHVLSREKAGQWFPERAIYRVVLQVQEVPASWQGHTWRGQLVLHADWQSPASRYFRQVLSVLVREVGF